MSLWRHQDGVTPYKPEAIHLVVASTETVPETCLIRRLHGLHDLLGGLVGFEKLQQSVTGFEALRQALDREAPQQNMIEEVEQGPALKVTSQRGGPFAAPSTSPEPSPEP